MCMCVCVCVCECACVYVCVLDYVCACVREGCIFGNLPSGQSLFIASRSMDRDAAGEYDFMSLFDDYHIT